MPQKIALSGSGRSKDTARKKLPRNLQRTCIALFHDVCPCFPLVIANERSHPCVIPAPAAPLAYAKRDVLTLVKCPCSSSNTHKRLSRLSYSLLNFEGFFLRAGIDDVSPPFSSCLRPCARCPLINTAPARTPDQLPAHFRLPQCDCALQAPRAPIRVCADRAPPSPACQQSYAPSSAETHCQPP